MRNINGLPVTETATSLASSKQPLVGVEMSVPIMYKGREASLTFSQGEQRLRVDLVGKKGRRSCVVNIPAWDVVNIVTSAEASALHGFPRHSKAIGKRGGLPSPVEPCQKCQPIARVESSMYTTSVGTSCHSSWALSHSRTESGLQGGTTTYFLCYVKKARGETISVSAVELTAASNAVHQQDLYVVVQSVLSAVYSKGCKKLLFFISAKSGNGRALSIYKRGVLPVLRASRHEVKEIVTTRARHAEDYVADLGNQLNDEYVVVAVGGDGMLHELFNGLDRRSRAATGSSANVTVAVDGSSSCGSDAPLLAKEAEVDRSLAGNEQDVLPRPNLPSTGKSGDNKEPMGEVSSDGITPSGAGNCAFAFPVVGGLPGPRTLPLIATISAGSGCGMAKTFGVDTIRDSVLALVHLNSCSKSAMNAVYGGAASAKKLASEETRNSTEEKDVSCSGNRGVGGMEDNLASGPAKFSAQRVACMSCTFGIINDIDRGSEKLRWMGAPRFTVYAVFLLLRGIRVYRCRLRYLPWVSSQGQRMQKLQVSEKLPTEEEVPSCTFTNQCPHCLRQRAVTGSRNCGAKADSVPAQSLGDNREECDGMVVKGDSGDPCAAGCPNAAVPPLHCPGEQDINFDDETLPWVTFEGKFLSIFVSNVPNASKDVMMTPYAHLNDGSVDVAFVLEKERKICRSDFVNIFTKLERGDYVKLPFVSYVKARAVELEAIEGDIMIDGEALHGTKVRIKPQGRTYEVVRGPVHS